MTVGILLLIIGIIGFMASYTATWMSVIVLLGCVVTFWGFLTRGGGGGSD